jgi:predicted DsbA family dithiol-disulfide isomerase
MTLPIEMVSDVVCPWCFIGKRRLEKALALRPQPDIQVHWRAFQLNPGMPEDGMERGAYLATKFGGPEAARRIYDTVGAAGQRTGVDFAFDRIRRTPNTVAAHRLIRFADRFGRQDETVEALFRGYFQDGRLIGDKNVLAEIATEVGLDPAAARDFLSSAEETEAVLAEDVHARQLGIGGVPCFIVDGRYALSGAQEPEAFLPVFDLVVAEQPASASAT